MRKVLAILTVLMLAVSAKAASVNSIIASQIAANGGNPVTLSAIDTSFETLIKGAGNVSSSIQVGDSLRGIFKIQQVGSQVPTTEWTALFQTEVMAITNNNGTTATLYFGPDANFSEANTIGATGAMVLMYEDTTPDFSSTGASQAADTALATNGSYYWALGMNGTYNVNDQYSTSNEFWVADNAYLDTTRRDVSTLATVKFALNEVTATTPPNPPVGGAVVLGKSETSVGPAPFTKIYDFVGVANAAPNQSFPSTSPWPVSDGTTITFQATNVVPLPAAMWAGAPLLAGLVFLKRRMTA